MSLRFHEIAERDHRILNPITEEQAELLGRICRLQPAQQLLDLACGKAEMLCQWAGRYGIQGTGVDLSQVFIEAAQARAAELGLEEQIELVQADASQYAIEAGRYDLISCLGASWIGGGATGTLAMMRPGLKPGGLLLLGEPYWIEEPPDEAVEWLVDRDRELFLDLAGTVARMEAAGLELVEMVLASHQGWDRYMAMQWMALDDWLRDNADHPDWEEIRQGLRRSKRHYLTYGRRYFGWGVFVLRPV